MNWTVQVRRLHSADVTLMRELLAMFAKVFGEPETYSVNQPSNAYLSDLLSAPHFIAMCATNDDGVVGGLVAYQLDKFEKDRREI
jgi:aminoglycoside 3-N-acetyltransferase I